MRPDLAVPAHRCAVLLGLLGLSSGCAQIAGIEDTSGDGLVGVSLSVERTSVGATLVSGPLDLAPSIPTYFVTDEDDPSIVTAVEAIETEPGLWTAEIFNQTPPVRFDLPDNPGPPFARLIALPNRDLLAAFDVLEHPDPIASDPMATLAVNATLDAPFAAGTFELFIVGTWTSINLGAPIAGALTHAPPPFAVSMMSSLTGRPIEQITLADQPLIIRRQGNQLDAVGEVAPFAQTGTDPVAAMVVPVALDQTLDIAIDPIAATNRFATVRPANNAPTFSWDLRAAPGADLGINTGPVLHAAAVTTETAVAATYANPFTARDWKTVLAWNGTSSRTVTPAGQVLPVTLSAGMRQLVIDPPAGLALDFPAGLPEQISINGMSLSRDDLNLSAPTGTVEVVADVDRTGATVHTLEVLELVPDEANTVLVPRRVLSVASLTPTFSIAPEAFTFETGKYYSLRVTSIDGLFPNIANGDLRTRALPVATSFADSGVFLVVP